MPQATDGECLIVHDGVQQLVTPKETAMSFFTSYRFTTVASNNFRDISDGTSNTLVFGR